MNDRVFTSSKIKSNIIQMAGAVLKVGTALFVTAIGTQRLLYSSLENDILSVRVYKLLSRLPVAVFCLYIKEKNEPYSSRLFHFPCYRFGVHSLGSLGNHSLDDPDKFPSV
jgi:hypothetical protein